MAGHPLTAARRGSPRGFTLVEVLVVIAIIAGLMALVAAIVPKAIEEGRKQRTRNLINNIAAELEALNADAEAFGRYPPTHTKDLRIGKKKIGEELGEPNSVNVGNETIFFVLSYPGLPGHQSTTEAEQIGNTDGDSFRANRLGGTDAQAREFIDGWGRPLVYFHSASYKEPRGLTTVSTPEGPVEVKPKRLPAAKGGQYLGAGSFQIFSLGRNGKQDADDDEDSDDVVYSGK